MRSACVGRPVREMEVKIIAISDAPIATLDDRELPPGEIGEIIARGPVVTKTYDALPEATAAAKIQVASNKDQELSPTTAPPGTSPLPLVTSAPSGAVWHRMGDCGYLDADGRLWFCGRKAERVESVAGTLHTEPCEQVFRRHPRASRCALIGLGERGHQRAALVVETAVKDSSEARTLARELRSLALQHAHTEDRFLFSRQVLSTSATTPRSTGSRSRNGPDGQGFEIEPALTR